MLRRAGGISVMRWLLANPFLALFVKRLLKEIKAYGGGLYLVGGIVRDLIERKDRASDVDLMITGLTFEELEQVLSGLKKYRMLRIKSIVSAGKLFSVFRVAVEWRPEPLDVALARVEESTGYGHKDFSVVTDSVSALEDSCRRDFTFNAIFFKFYMRHSRLWGKIVDYQGGVEALLRKEIVAVGNPADRFREDPLRMLRAVRQKNQNPGFYIEHDTWEAIKELAPTLVATISPERVAVELVKSFRADGFATCIDLRESGILNVILPEMAKDFDEEYDVTARMFSFLQREPGRELPDELLLACFMSQLAVCEMERKLRCNDYKNRKKRASGPAEPEYYKIKSTFDVIVRLVLPLQKQQATILNAFLVLVFLDSIKDNFAVVEELLFHAPYKDEIMTLYYAYEYASEAHSSAELEQILEKSAESPRSITGTDLNEAGYTANPYMKTVLRAIRNRELEGEIFSRKQAVEEASHLFDSLRDFSGACGS